MAKSNKDQMERIVRLAAAVACVAAEVAKAIFELTRIPW
jgi:hypothetical protein